MARVSGPGGSVDLAWGLGQGQGMLREVGGDRGRLRDGRGPDTSIFTDSPSDMDAVTPTGTPRGWSSVLRQKSSGRGEVWEGGCRREGNRGSMSATQGQNQAQKICVYGYITCPRGWGETGVKWMSWESVSAPRADQRPARLSRFSSQRYLARAWPSETTSLGTAARAT